MIVDSSAIVAILLNETQGAACLSCLQHAPSTHLSGANLLEVSIVLLNKGGHITDTDLDFFLTTLQIVIEPVTESQARIARLAYRQFGRKSERPAKLNFGDCFAYALAREKNEPLLFVGDNFTHTDIVSALALTGEG